MKKFSLIVLFATFAAALLIGGNVHAQDGVKMRLPDMPDLPGPGDINDDVEFDYLVEFAGPPQAGYMVIDDRGAERGPYDTYEEAYEAGMERPWVDFMIQEFEYQNWYRWDTFDTHSEARSESDWLRDFGFWTRIIQVPVPRWIHGKAGTLSVTRLR